MNTDPAPGSNQLRHALDQLRADAQERLRALEAQADDIAEARRDSNVDDEHDPEGSTIAFDHAQTAALAGDARRQLAEIGAALERVEQGTYGTCASCGRPIGAGRLEARPTASLCVDCQSRVER